MFRKLVSNLPFSPALIHDVGFYAKRLRNEEVTRRMTVLFVVLTLAMQSLTLFSPPESANASSEQDIVPGGVSTIDDFLIRYDHNKDDLRDILNTVGITRSEVENSNPGSIKSTNNTYVLTRYGQFSSSSNEAALSYQRSVGGVATRYFSPLHTVTDQKQSFDGWIGQSATVGWFGIIKSNGSLATKGLPSVVNADGNQALTITKTIRAANFTQDLDNAANNFAKPLDKLAYTLTAKNTGSTNTTTTFSIQLSDVLEYSSIIDGGGGSLDESTTTLLWPQVRLDPGESQERTFVVQVLTQIPTIPTGSSNPSSHDCTMNTSFGDNLRVGIDCPAIKTAEGIVGQLPPTGIFTNTIFALSLLGVALYFYTRTRLLKKEVRIIRHNINTGII